MILAAELAGFFAAHAIWCVSDADGLTPMVAFATEDGKRQMDRLAMDDAGDAVAFGRRRLDEDPLSANDGVLAFDGRITVESGKLDAIIVEMRCYAFPDARAAIAVPYTPKSSGQFRVHRPKLVQWHQCDDFNMDAVFEAFFRGVDSHEKGAEVWNAALD